MLGVVGGEAAGNMAARGALPDALMERLLKLGRATVSLAFHLADSSTILISSLVRP
jgi:hypothetical protein